MIERNQQTPAMEYGANLRATVSDDDALESGHVRIEADSTVSEAVIVHERAQQLVEQFRTNRDQLAGYYDDEIRKMTEMRDAALAKDTVYIGRAMEIVKDAKAYAELRTDYDRGINSLVSQMAGIRDQVEALEAYREDLANQQASQEASVDQLSDESRSIDAVLIDLTRRASQLEEQFVHEQASREQLEEHYAYGAPTTYHHGINNLSTEEQRQYRELDERYAQCQTEIRNAKDAIREITRADVIAEGEINNLLSDLQEKQTRLEQKQPEGVYIEQQYSRVMALMDAITEEYNVRFESAEQDQGSEEQEESQPEVNLRASVIDEEVTGWVPDAGIRVLRADNEQPRKGRWSLKRNR